MPTPPPSDPSDTPAATALIAEDEPLLAAALRAELARAWPALRILASVGDGESAVAQSLALKPDVLFFDIRMPGMDGLDAARALAEDWPGSRPFPQLVFVTAYDQYAVSAFEAQAVDYLLKPVQAARLQKTVLKVRQLLDQRRALRPGTAADAGLDRTLEQLRALLVAPPTATPQEPALQVIQASVGNAIHMVPIGEVLYFEAADKYVRVLTASREYLIRTPLRDLLPRLDGQLFWQIHRAVVVRAQSIGAVSRDDTGKLWIQLRGRDERLAVSRLYAHLFRAM
jgi:DNA-binding LytR/AlgR family response regulator